MRLLPALALTPLLMLLPKAASADAPPPEGQKYVDYSFTLNGLAAAPDQVVFGYPCGTSSGAPVDRISVAENGKPVPVGRRGGACTLYTTTKAKYDEFKATYVESNQNEDPKLQAFAAASVKCTGGPTPTFVIPELDPRSAIQEDLDVKTLTATTCAVTSRNVPSSSSCSSSGTPAPSSDGGATTTPAATDDGGCSMAGTANAAAPWLVALVIPALAFGTRGKKKRKAPR